MAVIVVGYGHRDEGEYLFFFGGDRDRLRLRKHDESLIEAVAKANPNTVVVLIGGGPIITSPWHDEVRSLVMAWYPGMEGGHAIADVLFGYVNPSGKLPCVFPQDESQLPPFNKRAKKIQYTYFHGYRWLDHHGHEPAFPFGFGLSYTSFTFTELGVKSTDRGLVVGCRVNNAGPRDGATVVQVYLSKSNSHYERAKRWLGGFRRAEVAKGTSQHIEIEVPWQHLAVYNPETKQWLLEPGDYTVWIGDACADFALTPLTLTVDELTAATYGSEGRKASV